MRFRRVEGFKDTIHVLWIDPDSGIFDRYQFARRLADVGPHAQYSRPIRNGGHRLDRIHDQVPHNQLQLDPVGRNQRQPLDKGKFAQKSGCFATRLARASGPLG
jgi:hypothetical protein